VDSIMQKPPENSQVADMLHFGTLCSSSVAVFWVQAIDGIVISNAGFFVADILHNHLD
jgi:hypothetical protein